MARPRVIVAGGGYAGLAAIKVLRARDDLAVTLIDPSPTHQLIPELPAALRPDGTVREHTVPFSTLLRDSGVVHRTDSITGVRAAERTVVLRSGAHLTFDWLIVSVGSMTRWPPIPGLRESALPFRTAADARHLRERLEGRCGLRVVILGGGLTGVEVAGELAARHQVHVVEMAPRILPEVGPGLSRYGSQVLQHNDVEISTATQVDRVDPQKLVIKPGQSIPFDVLVWTGGIARRILPG
ncbi:MAG: NAD(P)/FAD-dependent oxidoreductase, partial [Clostridia bacterium]